MHFKYCPYCGSEVINKKLCDKQINPFCPKCKIPLWDRFTTNIMCAVINEYNEIVLLRRNNIVENNIAEAQFFCVIGTIKIGESVQQTVRRTVKEEIGLDVEWMEYIESCCYQNKEILMLGYKAYVRKADFVLSKKVDFAEWVAPNYAMEKLQEGSIEWKLVKRCQYDIIRTQMFNNIDKELDLIRRRPLAYIGKKSVFDLWNYFFNCMIDFERLKLQIVNG